MTENSNEIISAISDETNQNKGKRIKEPKKGTAEKYSFLVGQTFVALALLIIILLFKMFGKGCYLTLREKYQNTYCKSLSPSEVVSSAKDVFKAVFDDGGELSDDSQAAENSGDSTEQEKIELTAVGFNGAYSDNISDDEECFDTGTVIIENSLVWPCRGRISDYFGLRADPFTGKTSYHNGIDIAVPSGTSVRATLGGKVTISKYDATYGNYIVITHSDGIKSLYAHLGERRVSAGDTVSANDVIALSGNTGNSTGPHLHFEILMGGTNRIDPLSLLPDD
ncbi:MAG: M23 family metallopeptidase [Acutalibacteraceae bacterium]